MICISALSPQSKKVVGFNLPNDWGPFCVQFACYPHACVGVLRDELYGTVIRQGTGLGFAEHISGFVVRSNLNTGAAFSPFERHWCSQELENIETFCMAMTRPISYKWSLSQSKRHAGYGLAYRNPRILGYLAVMFKGMKEHWLGAL